MMLASINSASEGHDSRTFECTQCDHSLTRIVARDPMKSETAGWQYSELRAPE